jgi:hypothetical protein
MKKLLKLISILILAGIAGLFLYTLADISFTQSPLKSPGALRHEIIASLSNPFPDADTMILNTDWWVCGNSDPSELPVIFDMQLEDENNKQLLVNQIRRPVLTRMEFHKVMDSILSVRYNNDYPLSLWDSCREGKVAASIRAEQLSHRRVQIYENYSYGTTIKSIHKDFTFDGIKWTFSIVDTVTEFITQREERKQVNAQQEQMEELLKLDL